MIVDHDHIQIINLCQQSPIGKKLPNALYVHISAIAFLSPQLQECDRQARLLLPKSIQFTIIKFNYEQPKISYLFYPEFDIDPHPALHQSIQVDLKSQTVQQRDYYNSSNPPILHRKETFVNSDYPQYQLFAQLTKQEEAIGLFHETHTIHRHSQRMGATLTRIQCRTKRSSSHLAPISLWKRSWGSKRRHQN